MARKYEVKGSKLDSLVPIYVHTFQVLKISDPISILFENGIRMVEDVSREEFNDRLESYRNTGEWKPTKSWRIFEEKFCDIDLDDGNSTRVRLETAEQMKIGDEVFYNVAVDEYTKFEPDKYPVQLNLVA